MSKKIQITFHTMSILGIIVAIILASFYDFSYSEAIYAGESIAVVGMVFGKLPAYFMLAMALGIFYKSCLHKELKFKSRLPLLSLYAFGIYLAGFLMGYSMVEDIVVGYGKWIVSAVVSIVVGTACILIVRKLSLDVVTKLKKWALITGIVVVVIIAMTLLLKTAWGRQRYVDIIHSGKIFTPWYKPQGMTGGSSFPSGHTAMAMCIFMLPMLYQSLPNLKQYATSMYILSWVVVIFIAMTRVFGGQHFMSDVAISMLISYLAIFVSFYAGYGIKLKRTILKESSWINKF